MICHSSLSFKEEVKKDEKIVVTNIKTYFVTGETTVKTELCRLFLYMQRSVKLQDGFLFHYAELGIITEGDKEFRLIPNNVAGLHNADETIQEYDTVVKALQFSHCI